MYMNVNRKTYHIHYISNTWYIDIKLLKIYLDMTLFKQNFTIGNDFRHVYQSKTDVSNIEMRLTREKSTFKHPSSKP